MNGMPSVFRLMLLGACVGLGPLPPAGAVGDGRVVLVQGTTSTPNEAERAYAESVTRRLGRWLTGAGVAHRVVNDEQLPAENLDEAKVLVLGYNPNPTAKELAALRSFTGLGGKLLVFYSADPGLAEIMQVKLGRYTGPGATRGWSAMRFRDGGPPHLPLRVFQNSRNIRPVTPATAAGRVIAAWEDESGRPTEQPACVLSSRGAWITHVLLDDGDTENKTQLLLALIGAYEPSVWKSAASAYLANAARVGRYEGRFRGAAEAARSIPPAAAALGRARAAYAEAVRLYSAARFAESVELARRAKDLFTEAYGYTQRPRDNEVRGVWAHSAAGLYPGDWGRTCAVLATNGLSDLFVNVAWPGLAHYDSGILPRSDLAAARGDQLAQCLAAARKHGLRAHVWKICWRMDGAPAELIAKMKAEGRLQLTDTGQTLNWLCPSHPDNVRWEKDAVREILRKYAVDGIHLDYIRFRDSHVCYCAGCRRRFEEQLGHKVARWPADVQAGPRRAAYFEWRRRQITRLVRDVGKLAHDENPRIRVSAAVYGKYPSCTESIAQDWVDWLKNGYVDFVCPMNYTGDLGRFAEWTRSEVRLAGAGAKIVAGIGVTAMESRLDPADVVDQISALRREGAAGFVLFDLNRTLEKETLPVLRLGATAAR
jgi:uncharacterized lipoprotein YddW (UPF0748 family)